MKIEHDFDSHPGWYHTSLEIGGIIIWIRYLSQGDMTGCGLLFDIDQSTGWTCFVFDFFNCTIMVRSS